LLTGDAGRSALTEAADFAPSIGLILPGIQRFQIPHHGSRRNVSSELLDRWLGPISATQAEDTTFTAICSSALKDEHHPRNSVVRAFIHRGAKVIATEGKTICTGAGDRPDRGWVAVTPLSYPEDQED
jgi:beta-lactamase superfamily II metal-dependent hydrolase